MYLWEISQNYIINIIILLSKLLIFKAIGTDLLNINHFKNFHKCQSSAYPYNNIWCTINICNCFVFEFRLIDKILFCICVLIADVLSCSLIKG